MTTPIAMQSRSVLQPFTTQLALLESVHMKIVAKRLIRGGRCSGISNNVGFILSARVQPAYGPDVPCSEICVYCFRRLPYVSVFIKHVKSHNYANERKNIYLSGMCDDLREQAATELDRMIAALTTSRGSDEVRPAKKRRVSDESKPINTSAQKETHPLLDQVVMPSDLTIGSHGMVILLNLCDSVY